MLSKQKKLQAVAAAHKLPWVGHTLAFVKNPLGFLEKIQSRYHHEKVVKLSLVGREFHLVLTPEDVKHVLQENNRNYHKSEAYSVLAIFLGNGLLTSEGDFWRRQRKLAQPAFYKQHLALMVEMMGSETKGLLDKWASEKENIPIDITKDILNLTLGIVTKALFSADVKHRLEGISEALNDIMHYADDILKSFVRFPLSFPTPANRRFKRAVQTVEEIIYDIIDARRQELKRNPKVRYDDLLDMLIHTKDEETGETMTDKQLRDEVTTIFMAGHETTANALSWALYLLAQHSEVVAKMRQELNAVLGKNGTPTFENIRELKYLLQVVQEVMRLYPPAWIMGRKALNSDLLSGYPIQANSFVLISIYLLHRHPDYWERPNDFDPDHFLPEPTKSRPTYAYIPFGGGPRMCIGNNFALMEMQIVIAVLIQKYDFVLDNTEKVELDPLVTLRPKKNLKIYLKPIDA